MIKMHVDFDKGKRGAGTLGIHAEGTIPDICTELEAIAGHIVRGLSRQIPEQPNRCREAAVMFSIALMTGAREAAKEVIDETT